MFYCALWYVLLYVVVCGMSSEEPLCSYCRHLKKTKKFSLLETSHLDILPPMGTPYWYWIPPAPTGYSPCPPPFLPIAYTYTVKRPSLNTVSRQHTTLNNFHIHLLQRSSLSLSLISPLLSTHTHTRLYNPGRQTINVIYRSIEFDNQQNNKQKSNSHIRS